VRLEGYELIVGSSLDAQFGPVLLFGAGGQLVEVNHDSALALPPLNSTLARRLMEQTRIYRALQGVRGRKPLDIAKLEEMLVRFSELVVEQPWIKEIDINPLLASPERLLALDARVVLHQPEMTEAQLPRPAIRPYPMQYVGGWTMKDGQRVCIRPIRPEDEPHIVRFHEKLSARTVYLRYFQPMKLSTRTSHERLTRICFIDYDREMALVAERTNAETGDTEIIGVTRLSKLHGIDAAESAVVLLDEAQGKGLGTELVRRSLDVARAERLKKVISTVLPENFEMRAVNKKLGFHIVSDFDSDVVRMELDL
jgi:acetyltransferase